MLKTKKILSVLLVVTMLLTMFGTAFALEGGEKVTEKGLGSELDRFEGLPFKPLTDVAGFGKAVPSGIFFVCSAWEGLQMGDTVYFENDGEIFTAIYGVQAFAKISEAYELATNNAVIKVGPGTYSETLEISKHGIKLYGNYAGVCPNGEGAAETPYDLPLSVARQDASLETVVNDCEWKTIGAVNGITFAGFTFLDKHQLAPSGSGSITVTGTYIFNNIFRGANKSYSIHCDRGTNYTVVIKNNRIEGSKKVFFIGGGGMYDVQVDDNYFVNCTNTPMWLTSCGNNQGIESLISFSGNVLNNCTNSVDLKYTNGTFGENLDYKRIQNNVFYKCGSSSKACLLFQYWPDFLNSSGIAQACTSTACKTSITGNTFYDIPGGVAAINFIGADSRLGKTINYKVSVNRNRFIFPTEAGGTAITSTLVGTIDATDNYYAHCKGGFGNEVALESTDGLFDISATAVGFLSMPFFIDYDMTKYGSQIQLGLGEDEDVEAGGFVPSESKVDNENLLITLKALTGNETVCFDNVIGGEGVDIQVFKDFSLTQPLENNILHLKDTLTNVYVLATDSFTKLSTKYDVVVTSNTDKTKALLRYILDATTENRTVYEDISFDGLNVDIALADKFVYFPFVLQVSPSASYKLYTDAECTTPYTDDTFYMEPDTTTVVYAKIVSGNGKVENVYTLNFYRNGSNDHDAKIFATVSPEKNTLIFNGRKTIAYRPGVMIDDAEFIFEVAPRATYTIYGSYNEETGELSDELSTMEESKKIIIGDAITNYYVEIVSEYGYSQIYTIYVYNDIKSTDNTIKGVTGIPDAVVTEDEIIINASNTLAVVNAHFDTNVFAKVDVYADADKEFAIPYSITTSTINKREVESRTFQLGVNNQKSFFYVDVTSETGVTKTYKLTLIKEAPETPLTFSDIGTHWAKADIEKAIELGLIVTDTLTAGKLEPNTLAQRQEIAAYVLKMMGIESYSFRNFGLSDLVKDTAEIPEWSYNHAKAVYQLGWMTTDAEGKFRPTASMTREDFFALVAVALDLDVDAAADYDITKFADHASVSAAAKPYLKALLKAGICIGDNGSLRPTDNITRAEVITVVVRANIID